MKRAQVMLAFAALLCLVELVVLLLMPELPNEEIMDATSQDIDVAYVPYMVIAVAVSFTSFFFLLIGGIVYMLKANLKKRWMELALYAVAFVLPIIWYYG